MRQTIPQIDSGKIASAAKANTETNCISGQVASTHGTEDQNRKAERDALLLLAKKLKLGEVEVEYLPHSESWMVALPDGRNVYGTPGKHSYESVRTQLLVLKSIWRKKYTGITEERWQNG